MLKRFVGTTLVGILFAACSGSVSASPTPAAATSQAAATPATTTPTQLKFGADGTPDLHGVTLSLGNSAGDATIGDTVVYLMSKTLEKWGATVNFQLGSGNTTELAVVSGQINATAGPMPAMLDAGLSIFGNSQVHVDYLLVSKNISTLAQLKGKTVAIATTVSPDNLLLDGALQSAKLTRSDITIALTGSNSASVNQALQGKVDVAFVHADALLKLNQNATFNVIANSNDLEPWDADSYLGAMPAWLQANPAYAEAIDLAWLHSANVFNTDKAQWVQSAVDFTKGTTTSADAGAAYDAFKKAAPWPTDGSGMDDSSLQKNFDVNKQNGQIKGAGDRPIAQWLDAKPWTDAVAWFKAHPGAF